ncbi:MAG: sigma-70 family RNA polymerase sigma factor [Saprospiraceae bacterium]|nr:sigma-70 family RNA polymerase sigma factor [Saprospiraceae bacterium]
MSSASDGNQLEHLFRHSYGKVIAILLRKFGASSLEDIEDAVQEALLKAMKIWPYTEIPTHPLAWLIRVAQNQLIDLLRKKQKTTFPGDELKLESEVFMDDPALENVVEDDQLKMIFTCCHPALSQEAQIILTLKLVAGFGNKEAANALLKNEEAVAKAYTRAKKKLQSENIKFDHTLEIGLRSRLHIVLKIIYLIFTEGYKPHQGNEIIKKDLCYEAIRLALLLDRNKYCQSPSTKALIALMCFHASRFEARLDQYGDFVDLEHQDRASWNRELIVIGVKYLNQATSASNDPLDYILQAFISYYHCIAPSFEETDWTEILRLYDIQQAKQFSPIIELNRLIPFSMVNGPVLAFEKLTLYESENSSLRNMLFYAIKGDLLKN